MSSGPKPRPRPRVRLVNTALTLVSQHGFADAGLAELTAHSRASRNSLYQHFPGGKAELVETSTSLAGKRLSRYIDAATSKGDPHEWIDRFIELWRRVLIASDYQTGCPVLHAALADGEPRVQAAATAVYEECQGKVADAIIRYGAEEASAKAFASMLMSSIEGAVARSRAARDVTPLMDVRDTVRILLDAVLATGTGSARRPGVG